MSYRLKKPYTDTQRADFVCLHQGLEPYENEFALYFLEPNETIKDNKITMNPNYENEIKERQKEEHNLKIETQISEIDKKRIRAISEPSVKDENSGETWLEY